MSEVGNDSFDQVGTSDEALTHCLYPEMIINKDFVQICGRCKTPFNDFIQFLCHLTKRYDGLVGKEYWSCPIVLQATQGFQAQKTINYL